MDMLQEHWVRRRNLGRCWTWSLTGEFLLPSPCRTELEFSTRSCTTSCLLCYLTSAYPEWALAFQFLITLDFSSHYMHMNRYVCQWLVCLRRYEHAR